MIKTERVKVYGQLEEIAEGKKDVAGFKYVNGKVVPVYEGQSDEDPVPEGGIQVAQEKVY